MRHLQEHFYKSTSMSARGHGPHAASLSRLAMTEATAWIAALRSQ
ncbi:MAG: hypothetical protein Q7T78_21250 [Rhodoferax sp.]|nr:hypothetical protein [Rhodoferax sp.]